MPLDASNLSTRVTEAAGVAFGAQWPQVQRFAVQEFSLLTARIVEIERLVISGLDQELARLLFRMQQNVAIQIIAGLTTLTLLAVEAAINAALAVIREAVSSALGFVLF